MIGVFDSGIGGLSVLREIHRLCPDQSTLYIADQKHIPYGQKAKEELWQYCNSIAQYLLKRGASIIVVACNTATAAAIDQLRTSYPNVPFVGMEPALKPAAQLTKSGKVGVLATAGTFKSQRYTQLMKRFAADVKFFENACVGLVEQIESGALNTPRTQEMLQDFINPMLENGIDTLILGCTHYPFVQPLIHSIVGEDLEIINPAPAVAAQVGRLVNKSNQHSQKLSHTVRHEYATSGPLTEMIALINRLENDVALGKEVRQNRIDKVPFILYQTFYHVFHNN